MSKETVAERDTTPEVAALRAKYVMPLPGPMYSKPVQIVKGRGQFVFDEKGRQYLDGFAGVATVSIGHSHPHWLSRIKAQMDGTTSLYLHPSLGAFAQRYGRQGRAARTAGLLSPTLARKPMSWQP